jgi:hypothetical protein
MSAGVCPEHGEPLNMFCKEHKKAVCQSCIINKHLGHICILISDEYDVCRSRLRNGISELKSSLVLLQEVSAIVNRTLMTLTSSFMTTTSQEDDDEINVIEDTDSDSDIIIPSPVIIRKINNNFDKLFETLHNRQKELIEEVKRMCDEKSQQLHCESENISRQKCINDNLCKSIKELLYKKTKSWIVEHIDELTERINNQLQSDATIMKKNKAMVSCSEISYHAATPELLCALGSLSGGGLEDSNNGMINICHANISKLFIDSNYGNKASLDELEAIVEGGKNVIANGFYSVLLHEGLNYNDSYPIMQKDRANKIMSKVMPSLLGHALNIMCTSDVPLLLGMTYKYGISVNVDYKQSHSYFKLAADRGNVLALDNLGDFYYYGFGVPVDKLKALRYYNMAANQGSYEAQYKVCNSYEKTEGINEEHA